MSKRNLLAGSSGIPSAMDFLDRWYGDAPRLLVSIAPDGPISSKCLWRQNSAQVRDWLKKEGAAGRNIYFHVNQPGWALDKRAEKKDIREVRALHVDIDPKVGEAPEQCKERALAALAKHEPPPSVVLDSGNGIQAFWLLDEVVQLDGSREHWENLEAYNIAIQKRYEADSCFNVDRIMRVPGTINVPNKKKRAKGRVEVVASLVPELTTWLKYPLSAFKPALETQQLATAGIRRGKVQISTNLPRFASTADIPVKLHDYTVMLIVNGEDVENPAQYPSRSEVLWRVLCDMVRAGADDDTIAAVILDPDFKISASVLDKPKPEDYAAEQIAGAREEAVHPALRELNAKFAVIESDRSGRCMVVEEDWDAVLNRRCVKFQNFDAFRNRFMHLSIEIGRDRAGSPITMPMGKWWLLQEYRRQYRTLVFKPDQIAAPDEFNLWRGFGFEPEPGDGHLNFLEFLRTVVCAGDEGRYRYLVGWIARAVQEPGQSGEVAIVMRGNKGTGKSFTATTLGRLFGQHFAHVTNPRLVTGDFNGHLRDCILLFADEAFHAGDKKHEGILKGIVTERMIAIEAKYADPEFVPNTLHLILASNEGWVVPASGDERRFCVLDLTDDHIKDTAFFDRLRKELEGGGYSSLLHHLQNLDLQNFDVRNVPETPGLEAQKIASLPAAAQALLQLLIDGELPNNPDGSADVAAMRDQQGQHGEPLQMGLHTWAAKSVPSMRFVSERSFAEILQSIGCTSCRLSRNNRHAWRFPPLPAARAEFDRKYGHCDWLDKDAGWRPTGMPPTPF